LDAIAPSQVSRVKAYRLRLDLVVQVARLFLCMCDWMAVTVLKSMPQRICPATRLDDGAGVVLVEGFALGTHKSTHLIPALGPSLTPY